MWICGEHISACDRWRARVGGSANFCSHGCCANITELEGTWGVPQHTPNTPARPEGKPRPREGQAAVQGQGEDVAEPEPEPSSPTLVGAGPGIWDRDVALHLSQARAGTWPQRWSPLKSEEPPECGGVWQDTGHAIVRSVSKRSLCAYCVPSPAPGPGVSSGQEETKLRILLKPAFWGRGGGALKNRM